MINKLISGGQTGADRAALDVAIELGTPHGGWIPKGRKTEDGRLPDKYQLKEMLTASYPKRTEQNVIDSHGTLIITYGELTGGSKYTQEMATKHNRPCLHIDLDKISTFDAAVKINNWLYGYKIELLNVAGSRASKDPEIYQATKELLKSVISLGVIKDEMPAPDQTSRYQSQTVEKTVKFLIAGLSLKDKTAIAGMEENELYRLNHILGSYIREHFGLWSGDKSGLMESCRSMSGDNDLHEDDASAVIIQELWKKLQQTHVLRVIK